MFERARQYLFRRPLPSKVYETLICDRESIVLQALHCHWSTSSQPEPAQVVNPDTQMNSSAVTLKTVTAASSYLTGGRHAVTTSTGQVVSQHRVSKTTLAELPWQPYKHLNGRSLLLGNSAGASCYYHWMMDILPKLGYLQKAGVDLNSIDHFLVREISHDFQKTTLSALGIDASRITECVDHPYHTCDELLILNLEHLISYGMNQFVPDWVNQTFNPNYKSPSSSEERIKLFISRPEGTRRAIINEDELIKLLIREGFTVAAMEGLSVQEQASLLSRTDVLIAAHGGALTNMVFAQPGSQIIELFGSHVYPYYYGLANLCGHHYLALLQNSDDYPNLANLETAINSGSAENQSVSQNANFRVDLEALATSLQTAREISAA